jgi:aldose 1-epimerase
MLSLRAGEASLVLAPEIGGSILGWTVGSQAILRRASADAIMARNGRGMACFPLVPYSNRIAGGKFPLNGRTHDLALNFGDHPHSIHGIGWQHAWEVDEAGPAIARLALTHSGAANWPFAFRATQAFRLSEDALHVSMEIENLDARPAPAGLGLHPFFPAAHRPVLHFAADSVWTNGADMLPTAQIAVPETWDHLAGRPVGSAALDNCFAAWRGRADIAWARPGPLLSIEATELFRHLVVFTPLGANFFCVEPVSHMNDALNRLDIAGHGMHILEPGQSLQGEILFRVLDL